MSDEWDFYFHQIGTDAASTFVNLGIHDDVPDRKRPFLLRIKLKMQLPRPDGLSSADEYEVLRTLEEKLTTALKRKLRALYVGRTTGKQVREFSFYAPKATDRSEISRALNNFPEYEFEFSCESDAEWRHYLDLLYPDAEEFQTIKNQRVLEALEKHGDTLTQERPVTHWSFFETPQDRQAFISDALNLGFSIHDLHENGPTETPFVACLERDDHVDYPSINQVVLELFRLTENHHGFYDGWETQVVGGEQSECNEESAE